MDAGGNRRIAVVVLGSLALLVLLVLVAENAFNLKFVSPRSTGSILFFTALSGLSFLLFLMLVVLLLRNILKLYASEQSRVLGSRLRTRLLLGALLLSVAPAFFMLFFNYLLMNRSIDRWFSQPVVQLRSSSMQMAMQLSRYAAANARAEAESLANSPAVGIGDTEPGHSAALDVFRQHKVTLQGGFVVLYRDGGAVNHYQLPQEDGPVYLISGIDPVAGMDRAEGVEPVSAEPLAQVILRAARRTDDPILRVGSTAYMVGAASSAQGLVVVVGLPLPAGADQEMEEIQNGARRYWGLLRARRRVRQTYFLVLLMLTGLTLFISSWLALFFSKQVTRPVEALADAMDEMASGDYGARVDVAAAGELGELVRSFNHMATDLETSRSQLEASTQQLSVANAAIDERRRELETVLETIPSGVATLDDELRILQANRAFQEMIDPMGEMAIVGKPIQELFPAESAAEIGRVLRRSRRLPAASTEIEAHNAQGPLHLIFTATELRGSVSGHLVVMDNVTDVLRAQKQMAWKEVAQRVAHEIKNPLTPIALSAERIDRHLARGLNEDSAQALRGATAVIRSSVETLRQLVDQFAALADFPAARPAPTDLNTIVESTLVLFEGRLKGIELRMHLASNLPAVMADADAMKRALSNLIDNAAEAMQASLLRVLTVRTGWNSTQTMAEIVIADTGHGITEETRERLFLPFFSTRRRGTGLGLSIAAKIVQEHQGNIRVEKNLPAGACFIVEIPLADAAGPQDAPVSDAERGGAMNHVLVVDDEPDIRRTLEVILAEEGYAVTTAATASEALELVRDAVFDAVLLDVWLPDRDGLEVLKEIRDMNGCGDGGTGPEIIIISGHGTIESAVRATKLGAYDFLEKPLSLERTLIIVKNAIEARRLRVENREFQLQLTARARVTGESVPVKALRQQIRLMAPTNGRVLIYGESGTGKEVIARAMHAESQRADRVFVELNCAAIPEDYIESELFGYRHNALPGGPPEKRGTFERADGGTLFLDEVGDMSLKTQAKVLRALDEQQFTAVGAANPTRVDVRLIAATNKNLEEEIAKGNFREDLFYRLNVIPFYVPPLRERKEDIPLLSRELLREFGRQYGRARMEINEDALVALQQYHWPGNVRELKNVLERVMILNPQITRIERKHLPVLVARSAGRRGEDFSSLQQAREAYERDYILRKLEDCHSNVSRAAEILGLERSHLYRKMKALGISAKEG